MRVFLLSALLSLMSVQFASANSCLEEQLVVDTQLNWNLAENQPIDFYLPSRSSVNGNFFTRAAMHIKPQSAIYAEVMIDFVMPGLVSLPYNLYKIEITVGNYTYTQDLTFNCEEPGGSIYPGQQINLPTMQFPKNLDANETAHIKVWGHL